MTMGKIVRRNQLIARHLSEIALHHGRIDADGALQPDSPHFHTVLSAQERLLNALEQLLEKLPGRTSAQNS